MVALAWSVWISFCFFLQPSFYFPTWSQHQGTDDKGFAKPCWFPHPRKPYHHFYIKVQYQMYPWFWKNYWDFLVIICNKSWYYANSNFVLSFFLHSTSNMNQFVQDKGTPVLSADERAKVCFAFWKELVRFPLIDIILIIISHYQYLYIPF